MENVYRLVTTLISPAGKTNKNTHYLQFLEYVDSQDGEGVIELVKNSIRLKTGMIFCDAMNMSYGKASEAFEITEETTFDYARYIDFLKEICSVISKDAMMFCYNLYSDFYEKGHVPGAYVPTMNVRMELDCSEDGYLVEYYYFEDFEDLLVYDFYSAIKERTVIKDCILCGTYFLTENRSDETYCSAECRKAANKERSRKFYEENIGNENEKLKRRIASRLQQRTKVTNEGLREDREKCHQEFIRDAKKWKKRIKAGETNEMAYRLWLQAQDKKYSSMVERKN